MQHRIAIAALLFVIAGPLLLAVVGFFRGRREAVPAPGGAVASWNGQLVLVSAMLCVLAFNATFFLQELFLVVPKAFTPGLEPTLFHNNHSWEGDHPLASLFQGTGALAIFLTGTACALLLSRGVGRTTGLRLFLVWMAYHGLFQSLPQVVAAAIVAGNDVGMAMDYLGLSATAKAIAAFVALASIPPLALWLARQLLGLAGQPLAVATARARTRSVFHLATLPALIAIPLIVLYRVPREFVEVVVAPVVVMIVGVGWMQAGAWALSGVQARGDSATVPIAWLGAALVLLLLIFQCVLRPGIAFF